MLPAAARVRLAGVTMAGPDSASDGRDHLDGTSQREADRRSGAHGRAWTYGRPGPVKPDPAEVPQGQNAGWTIFSYLLSGMAAYGLIGWLVGRVTHLSALFPVGMLVGLVLAIVLIIFRYGRP